MSKVFPINMVQLKQNLPLALSRNWDSPAETALGFGPDPAFNKGFAPPRQITFKWSLTSRFWDCLEPWKFEEICELDSPALTYMSIHVCGYIWYIGYILSPVHLLNLRSSSTTKKTPALPQQFYVGALHLRPCVLQDGFQHILGGVKMASHQLCPEPQHHFKPLKYEKVC